MKLLSQREHSADQSAASTSAPPAEPSQLLFSEGGGGGRGCQWSVLSAAMETKNNKSYDQINRTPPNRLSYVSCRSCRWRTRRLLQDQDQDLSSVETGERQRGGGGEHVNHD